MVSNFSSVFRNRNQQDKKSKDKKGAVSTSSEEQPQPITPVMITVPTVTVPTVTVQSVSKEVEVLVEPEPLPSSSVVEEVQVLTPNENEVKTEPEQPSECTLCSKVESFVKPYYENLRDKYQKIVERLLDPSLHATIRSEFMEYLPSFLLACAIFFFAITFVSFLKLLRHAEHNEPSFFCRYFSGPFAPLFDALCQPEPVVLSEELPRVMSNLLDEIMLTISEFFHTISKGFTVFGTLYKAIWQGLCDNVFFGFHELAENMGENISYLIHFIVQFVHLIIHLFLSSIATVAGAIAGVFTSIHDYLQPTPPVW